jgi:hypothetical protein
MSKRKMPPSRRTPEGYDVAMIRDFLDHLMWELRIQIYEHETGADAPLNPELTEMLEKYIRRRGTVAVIFNHATEKQPSPGELRELHAGMATLRKSQLRCLECLQTLFGEALKAARAPRSMSILKFEDAAKAIELIKEYQRKHDAGESWGADVP